MDKEQRIRDRTPHFEIAELVAKDNAGNEEVHSIMVRDESPMGLGCVFIGQDPPNPEGTFFLRRKDGSQKRTRIVWMKKVADYVSLIGMEMEDG